MLTLNPDEQFRLLMALGYADSAINDLVDIGDPKPDVYVNKIVELLDELDSLETQQAVARSRAMASEVDGLKVDFNKQIHAIRLRGREIVCLLSRYSGIPIYQNRFGGTNVIVSQM